MKGKLLREIIFVTVMEIMTLPSFSQIVNPDVGKLDSCGEVLWYDAKYLNLEGKGWENTQSYYDRLPLYAKEVVTNSVWKLSHCSSGMYVRFSTDAKEILVCWALTNRDLAMPHMPATGVSGIDLYARDKKGELRFCANGRPGDSVNTVSFKLPPSDEYVLYLPLYNGIKSLSIGVARDTAISRMEPFPDRSSVVFYGTSITQGACASRPGMATTSIVGRMLNLPVINLGFSGSGKMELGMAEVLSELNPAVFVLDCLWNMSPEMIYERVEPFIYKLREARPTTPILLVEDSRYNNQLTARGVSIRNIYDKLKNQGVKNIYFLSNRGMLGEDWDGTVDGTHPNDLGNFRQAVVFAKYLRKILRKQK